MKFYREFLIQIMDKQNKADTNHVKKGHIYSEHKNDAVKAAD